MNIGERNTSVVLKTGTDLGPGAYTVEIKRKDKVFKAVHGQKPKKFMTLTEKACALRPGFNQTSGRPDVTQWETGFSTYNPSPVHYYTTKGSFGGNIVPVDEV